MALTEPVDITPKGDGGVLKQIIREGTGTELPANGSKVQVHYVGTLLDGTKFDSSRDRGDPFEFNMGKGNVIKAWDLGVASMKMGEVATLTCGPAYAYGDSGSPPTIPAGATLRFEVEMLGWRGEDISPKKDGSIERYQVKAGDGFATPNDGALVEVHLVGSYEGTQFEERDASFNLGEGSDLGICEGVEKALEKFKGGETSRIIIQPTYAFGKEGKPDWNVPANAIIEYTITLKSFEKAKESWSLDAEERVEQARLFKEKGTAYFKAQKYPLAIKMYKKVIALSENEKESNDSFGDDRKALLLSANLNLSLCHLKLVEHFEARDAATAALMVDEGSEKAYFRRGQAHLALEEPQLALKDFNDVLRLEPNNKAAQAQLAACKTQIKHHLQREKQIYANMFDKFAKVDAQVN